MRITGVICDWYLPHRFCNFEKRRLEDYHLRTGHVFFQVRILAATLSASFTLQFL